MLIIKSSGTRFALRHCGLAATASSPSIALIAGGAGGLLAPGFRSMLLARAGESVFRGSLFRTGYESFYAPVAASEKRPAKSIIDVCADRLGAITAGGFLKLA